MITISETEPLETGDDGTGWSMDVDLAEAICFSSELTNTEADIIEAT